MTLRQWPSGGVAIHDLAHLNGLSDEPGLTLFVSQRTLYVLQNLVAQDATLQSRYATDLSLAGYHLVQDDDPLYQLYLDVVERLGVEVIEMPEVIDLLTDIKNLLNFQGPVEEEVLKEATAGLNTVSSDPVPAGEVWDVQAISMMNLNTAPARCLVVAVSPVVLDVVLVEFGNLPAETWLPWTGSIEMATGALVRAYFFGCAAGDDLYLRFMGRKYLVE